MLKAFRVWYKFYYDGELEYTTATTRLLESPREEEFSGTDFDSLWNLHQEHSFLTPFNAYERKKGRCLEFWNYAFRYIKEWKHNCKPWKLVVTSKEIPITMKELGQFDADTVIQYLKEHGIAVCLQNFKEF